MKKQVERNHYYNFKYNDLKRFISYWYQINTIVKLNPNSVLEIGVGNKIVCDYLQKSGIKTTTVDIDKNLKPDYVADIYKLPFKTNSFDVVCAFEVLEHIPFEVVPKAIEEMKRVSRKFIVISVPNKGKHIIFRLKIWKLDLKFFIKLPIPKLNYHFDGEHYWELDSKNYKFSTFKSLLRDKKIKTIDEFKPKENPYHYFFILKK